MTATHSQLPANELGLEQDKLVLSEDGEIMIQMKINGRNEEVGLKEAVSQTQYFKANEEKARTLAEEKKSFESQRQELAESYQQQLQQVQGLGEMLQQKLTQDFQSVDWQALRQTDPAEWAAKQQEFAQRNQELQMAGMALGEQMRQEQERTDQLEMQQRQKILELERHSMIESNPEWADESKMKSDLSEIVEYAKKSGFSDDELQDVIYSRHVNVLRKAFLYDKGQTVVEKKVKQSPPKMQRASTGRLAKKKSKGKYVNRASTGGKRSQ